MYNEGLDQSAPTHMTVHGICRSSIQSEHTRATMVESNMRHSADQGLNMYIRPQIRKYITRSTTYCVFAVILLKIF